METCGRRDLAGLTADYDAERGDDTKSSARQGRLGEDAGPAAEVRGRRDRCRPNGKRATEVHVALGQQSALPP